MTFLELCQLTRQECGVQGSGPTAVTSQTGLLKRVVGWVRDANNEIQTAHADWDFLWAEFTDDTVADSDAITKPSDLGMWDRDSFVIDKGTASGMGLSVIEFPTWRANHYEKTATKPYGVTILPNGNLRFDRPADDIYELYANYWTTPVVLAANTDTPAIPARFHRAIVARAKMFFFEDEEAWDNYKAAKVEFDTAFNALEAYALPGQQYRSQSQPLQLAVSPK